MLVNFVAWFVVSGNVPLVNTYLDSKGYSPLYIGLQFSLVCVMYALANPAVQFLKTKMPKRALLTIGMLLQAVGVFITGICGIKFLEKYDVYRVRFNTPYCFSVVGFLIFGFGTGFVTIPVLPEIMEGVEEKFGDTYNKKVFCNNLSGYFIVSQALGEFFGPLLCSYIASQIKFRPT